MNLTAEVFSYPNPEYRWCIVRLDGEEIGRCDVTADGYVLRGSRKARPLDDVAATLLRRIIQQAKQAKLAAIAAEAAAEMRLRGLKVAARRRQCLSAT